MMENHTRPSLERSSFVVITCDDYSSKWRGGNALQFSLSSFCLFFDCLRIYLPLPQWKTGLQVPMASVQPQRMLASSICCLCRTVPWVCIICFCRATKIIMYTFIVMIRVSTLPEAWCSLLMLVPTYVLFLILYLQIERDTGTEQ